MAMITRIISLILRAGELMFASIVADIIASYLLDFNALNARPKKRFIYSEVIAGVSILFSLFWLLPFLGDFFQWAFDVVLAAAWLAAFDLLVNSLQGLNCGRSYHWPGITHAGLCSRWKAAEAFSFLSAISWLISIGLGISVIGRMKTERGCCR